MKPVNLGFLIVWVWKNGTPSRVSLPIVLRITRELWHFHWKSIQNEPQAYFVLQKMDCSSTFMCARCIMNTFVKCQSENGKNSINILVSEAFYFISGLNGKLKNQPHAHTYRGARLANELQRHLFPLPVCWVMINIWICFLSIKPHSRQCHWCKL